MAKESKKKIYQVATRKVIHTVFLVEADSPEEAEKKISEGEGNEINSEEELEILDEQEL